MTNKERIKNLYQQLLRMSKYYSYYAYQLQDCNTKKALSEKKTQLYKEILCEFHFLGFYPEDCLKLAYHDNYQKIKFKEL